MLRIAIAILLTFVLLPSAQAKSSHHRHHHYAGHHQHLVYNSGSIVAHPAGCPWRAFCGCGASARIFGHPVRDLYLAANWFRFPRSAAAPGMAAVRRHHVFIIEAVNGDGTVTAYDANSGGHLTRIHRVSLAGYTVVNPHARRTHYAQAY